MDADTQRSAQGGGPTNMVTRRIVLMVSCVVVSGCGGASAPGEASAPTVRDSAGVRIVENDAPLWPAGEAQGWAVGAPVLTVGGEADDDLFQVSGARLLPGGDLAVSVAGTSQVRFYDAQGRVAAVYGGPGDGPEEFRLMATMGSVAGDTVWVYDFGHARLALLTPRDGFVGSVSLRPQVPAGMTLGVRGDRSVVVGQLWGLPPPGVAVAEGLARDPAAYVAYRTGGEGLDTLCLVPGREVLHRREGERMTMGVVPFAHAAVGTLLGDDLVVGDQVTRQVQVRRPDGGLRMLVRWAGGPLRLSQADVRAWKEARVAEESEAERPSVRAWLEDAPAPATRPAYGMILADATGDLWIAEYAAAGEEPQRWHVFDAGGRWLATVDMPGGFRPLSVQEDRMVGLSRDALDVERLEVRPLTRRAPP